MSDTHYPTIPTTFFTEILDSHPKVAGILKNGKSTIYILKGSQPIAKRMVVLREVNGEIEFNHAVSLAHRMNCMTQLFEWWKKNKNWKDGGYFVK
jgi:hypothetical protein